MNGRLKIELDNSAITKDKIKLVLGGFCIAKIKDEEGKVIDVAPLKILGLFKEIVDGYNINTGTLMVVSRKSVTPAKITIDGYDVAKEDYRAFVGTLDNDFDYFLQTFNSKPTAGQTATIVDMRLLDSPIYSNVTNREVIISKFNNTTKRYDAIMPNNKHLSLKRHQFSIDNNTIEVAFLKHLNEQYL